MAEDGPRSVHGGQLPFDERWMRRDAQQKLFGDAPDVVLGRYHVHERLGAGGMGTVFAARDPELERDVAIKVLHARDPRAEERLRREARALAALAHPNVVMVFEVGESDGVVFIAMEHVEGETLRAWQRERPHAEVLEAYLQAGHGLAAAHRAGLVHGDFKPDNVLVHRDGRVRVADFGLAARADEHPLPQVDAQTLDAAATTAGGTPGYRAPELDQPQPADARSDQYSFCVSLAEALAGQRFENVRLLEQLAAPRRTRAALRRGLHDNPAKRFPSLESLLEALAPRRRTWGLLVPIAVLGVGAIAMTARGRSDCDAAGPTPWSEARARVRVQFENDPGWVRETWPTVDDELRAQETLLARTEAAACRAEPGRTPRRAAMSARCLETARRELTMLTDALGDPQRRSRTTAALRLAALLPIRRCNDDSALDRYEPIRSLSLRDDLLSGLHSYSRLPDSPPAYEASVVEEALSAGSGLEGLARRLRAHDALGRGDHEAAIADLQAAATLAETDGDALARVDTLATLSFAIGQDTRRLAEAERVALSALSALDAGPPQPLLRARLLHDLASVQAHARPPDLDAAIGRHRDATQTLLDALGPNHPLTLRARLGLGAALTRARELDEAVTQLTRAADEIDVLWPRSAPTWLRSRRLLGLAHLANEAPGKALRLLSAVRDARVNAAHSEPIERARDAYNVALAQAALRRDADALATLQEGFVEAEAALGPTHPELTPWAVTMGKTAARLGRHDDATSWFERGLRLLELDGAEPKEFAKVRMALAEVLAATDAPVARVHLEGTLDFLRSVEGFDGLRRRAESLDRALKAEARPANAAQPRDR